MSGGLLEGALASAIATAVLSASDIGLRRLTNTPQVMAWLRDKGLLDLDNPADQTFQAAYVHAYCIVAVDREYPTPLLALLRTERAIAAAILAVRSGGTLDAYLEQIEDEVRATKLGDEIIERGLEYKTLAHTFLDDFRKACADTENPAQALIRSGVESNAGQLARLIDRQARNDERAAIESEAATERLTQWNNRALARCPEPPVPAYEHALYYCTAADSLSNYTEVCRRVALHELMEVSAENRRLFAVAPGGYGKTSLVSQAAPALAKFGPVIVIRADDHGTHVEVESRSDLLMLAPGSPTWGDFEELGTVAGCGWVIVDGLNQWTPQTQKHVRDILGGLTTEWSWVRCLATTRENQEVVRATGWHYLRLSELSDDSVSAVLHQHNQHETYEHLQDSTKRILRIPFYLDLFTRNPTEDRTRVAMIATFLGFASEATAPRAAELGWKYLTSDAGKFGGQQRQESDFFTAIEAEWPEQYQNMVDRGVIEVSEGDRGFTHHLHGDFLAASAIASAPDRWGEELFDQATLDGSSADALVLALELASKEGVEQADSFVDAVYDWNYALALEAIEDVELVSGQPPVSRTVAAAIWIAQGVKLLDPVPQTRERARARLLNYRSEMARSLAGIVDEVDGGKLIEQARAMAPDADAAWSRVFFRGRNAPWSEAELNEIADGSSIVGWTVSNVLRRSVLEEMDLRQLRTLGQFAPPTVRWRVAHALGAHASKLNLACLLERVETDDNRWVRYGAARAACEVAVRMPDSAVEAAERLIQCEPNLDWLVLREIGASVFVDGCTSAPGWLTTWKTFFQGKEAQAASGSVERKYWAERVEEIDAMTDEQPEAK